MDNHAVKSKSTEMTVRARSLRYSMTPAEAQLWSKLRAHSCVGFKFRRQAPIGQYIVDFVCHQKGLVVEIDGDSHDVSVEYDAVRTKWLEGQGYLVVRFTNQDVRDNLEGVWESIRASCQRQSYPLS